MTLRSFVHPLDAHGTAHVSGISPAAKRPRVGEPSEDVATARVVRRHPVADRLLPLAQRTAPGPVGHLRPIERDILARPDHPAEFDQRAPLERVAQFLWCVRGPEPAPRHEIGVRRDRSGQIVLQQREVTHHIEQPGRARAGEQLRPDGDTPGLGARERVDTHRIDASGTNRQRWQDLIRTRQHRGWSAQAGRAIVVVVLELRPNCECCDRDLPPDSPDAMICTFECTFCRECVDTRLGGRCPNCGGAFAARPIRPPDALVRHPASTTRVLNPVGCAG